MTDQQEDTTPRTWVAIDIAKRRHVVLVEFSDGKRRPYRVQRQLEEVDRFVSFLHAQDQPVRIGFEPGTHLEIEIGVQQATPSSGSPSSLFPENSGGIHSSHPGRR